MPSRARLLTFAAAVPLLLAATATTGEASAATTRAASRQPPGSIALMSHAPDGRRANAASANASVSGNGRFVAYVSYASNLVAGDTNGLLDAFVWDAATDTNALLTKGFDGSPANGSTFDAPSMSTDGRYITFESSASNLVPNDTNQSDDIFLVDMHAGTTQLISKPQSGGQANADSLTPNITGDGRFVTYMSDASNLVAADPNGHTRDIFRYDTTTGSTVLITHSSTGGGTDGLSFLPTISGDGNVVTFESLATNLVAGDTNGQSDVFAYDVAARKTTLISVAADGGLSNGPSYQPSISADGKLIVFSSAGSNLVAHDGNGVLDVFVRDRTAGTTTALSALPNGHTGNSRSESGAISADGTSATFISESSNLSPLSRHHRAEVYLENLATKTMTMTSVGLDGKAGDRDSGSTSISADGDYVAFSSAARDLATVDFRKGNDVFRYRRAG